MPKQKPADDEPEFTPKEYAEGGTVEPGSGGMILSRTDDYTVRATPTLPVEVIVNISTPALPVNHYERKLWKGVVEVFQRLTCGRCDNSRDEIILHVITHAPANERAKLFEQLMKEK